MKKSKSALILEFFSEKPAYRQKQRFGYVLAGIVVALTLISLVMLFTGTVQEGENQVLPNVIAAILIACLGIVIPAVYLMVSPIFMDHKARKFIAERIESRFSGTGERASNAFGSLGASASVLQVFGYTADEVAGKSPMCLIDSQKSFFSTHYQASVFIVSGEELIYYTEKTVLSEPESLIVETDIIPIADIREVVREFRKAQDLYVSDNKPQAAYPCLVIRYKGGLMEVSLAHYDHFDSNKNQFFDGSERKLKEMLVQGGHAIEIV